MGIIDGFRLERGCIALGVFALFRLDVIAASNQAWCISSTGDKSLPNTFFSIFALVAN